MSTELDRPGGGVAAFMLGVGTLLALERNGTLAHDELADIVERSLATLKTMDTEMEQLVLAAAPAANVPLPP